MKALDKLTLFQNMQQSNADKMPDMALEDLNYFLEHIEDQSKYWKDKTLYTNIVDTIHEIQLQYDRLESDIKALESKQNELVRKEEVHIFQDDYARYESIPVNLEAVEDRLENYDPEFVEKITAKIQYYSDWRHAGVDLNPTSGNFTRTLLACDPLYVLTSKLVDVDKLKSKFNTFFAERRLYQYSNYDDLPQEQLGLAVNIGEYEHIPIEPIKDELKKVYNLLKPGGYFIFTYNNCEYKASLDFCGIYRSYNTKTLMKSLTYATGFDTVEEGDFCNGAHSLLIVKKPGELTSLKNSAPVVKVIK